MLKVSHREKTKRLAELAVLLALEIIIAFTPLGTIQVGPIAATLGHIPVIIAAVVLGTAEGAFMGFVFGLLSFLQCLGIGIPSGMGATLVSINPLLAFIQRFVPRALDGLLVGLIFSTLSRINSKKALSIISGIVSGTGFVSVFSALSVFSARLV